MVKFPSGAPPVSTEVLEVAGGPLLAWPLDPRLTAVPLANPLSEPNPLCTPEFEPNAEFAKLDACTISPVACASAVENTNVPPAVTRSSCLSVNVIELPALTLSEKKSSKHGAAKNATAVFVFAVIVFADTF